LKEKPNPTCTKCGEAMTFVAELKAEKGEKKITVRVFSCTKCQTFDHVIVEGAISQSG